MIATHVATGDFSTWKQACNHAGGVMAWNWPPYLSLDFAKRPLFLAVAIGLYQDNALAIRTPPYVPNSLVTPLMALVMREQAAGVPIALSLTDDHDVWSPEPDRLALVLHSTDQDRLDGYLREMSALIGGGA